MLITDFTGTYDYEKAEALHSADYILEDLREGLIAAEELPAKIERERAHWSRMLRDPQSFADFDRHFHEALRAGGAL